MKARNTLVALLLLAGVSSFVYVYEYRGAAGREAAARRAGRLLAFERSGVLGLVVEKDGSRVAAERSGGAWRLTEPLAAAGDDVAINDLINVLEGLNKDRVLTAAEASDLKPFGLLPPVATVKLRLEGGGEPSLDIGEGAPIGGGRYVKAAGQVAVTGSQASRLTEVTADSLRDKALVHLPRADVRAVTVRRESGALRIEKTGERWQIVEPERVPADRSWSSDLLYNATSLRALAFPDEASLGEGTATGLTPPRIRLGLEADGSRSAEILIGADTPPGATPVGVYARAPGGPLAVVEASLREVTTRAADDCRDRHPLILDRWELTSLAASGPEALSLRRPDDGSEWVREGGAAVDQDAARSLLDAISELEAEGFETEKAGPLLEPVLVLRLAGRDRAEQELRFETDSTGKPSRVRSDASVMLYRIPAGARERILASIRKVAEPPAKKD